MFDRITIVNVDGRPGDLLETQRALHHSAMQLPGARCLMLSAEKPKSLLPPIEHIQISPLGYLEYSLFITYALHHFIETDYALIVQNDGWVLNGSAFTQDFFEFDYIGAPTAMADIIMNGTKSRTFVRKFHWAAREIAHEPGVKINFSMNGGFSLRSRKFLKTPSLLQMDYRLRPPEVAKGRDGYWMRWNEGDVWEDVYHCVINRAAMDDAGIRFPPVSTGVKFAFEHLNPIIHKDVDVSKIFGHHMSARRLVSLDPLTMRYARTEKEALSTVMEDRVIEAFRKLGYKVEFENPL
jgi:hypothetical protein